jgi:lysyl-tRNA synthetase class II
MKKSVLFAFCLLFISQIFAQTASQNINKYVPVVSNSKYLTEIPKQKNAPEGSVYIIDEWVSSTIVFSDATYMSNLETRYNLKSKFIEILNPDNTIGVVYFGQVDYIITNEKFGKSSIYANCLKFANDFPELKNSEFAEVLVDGKATLIDDIKLEVIQANYNPQIDAGKNYDTYTKKHTYYIINNGKLLKIKKNKKSILNALQDKQEQISTYIKTNKLKMSNIENIINVVNYYNELYEEGAN